MRAGNISEVGMNKGCVSRVLDLRLRASRLSNKLRGWGYLIGQGRHREFLKSFRNMVWSKTSAVGLRRDLTHPWDPPHAAIALTIRPLRQEDLPGFFETDSRPAETAGVLGRMERAAFLHAGIGTCFVGVSPQGEPCYLQWLIGPSDNDKMQALFRGRFPRLKEDEALLEGAFTLERFRRLGIMAAAMSQIAQKGAGLGARYVITFVGSDNVHSLKGCRRAGFHPYLVREARRRFFFTQTVFIEPSFGEFLVA